MFGLTTVTLYLIVGLVVSNVVTGFLWRHEANAHDAYKTEIELRAKVQEEHIKSVVKEQQKITEDTTNGWNQAVLALRADFARRLRESNSGAMSGISRPPSSIDAIPSDAMAFAGDCAETTLQLNALQGWIRRQKGNE